MAVSTGRLGVRRNTSPSGLAMRIGHIGPDGRPMLKEIRMDKDRIINAVKGGMSYAEAAAKFGVTRNVVAGFCYRAGVKVGRREEKRLQSWRKFLASPNGETFRQGIAERNRLRWAQMTKRARASQIQKMIEGRAA